MPIPLYLKTGKKQSEARTIIAFKMGISFNLTNSFFQGVNFTAGNKLNISKDFYIGMLLNIIIFTTYDDIMQHFYENQTTGPFSRSSENS
jgi:hypothetical protein